MKQSKQNDIEKHLLTGQSITGLQAIDIFSVYRLSSVILRLRNKGHNIKTDMIESENGTIYGKYFIAGLNGF